MVGDGDGRADSECDRVLPPKGDKELRRCMMDDGRGFCSVVRMRVHVDAGWLVPIAHWRRGSTEDTRLGSEQRAHREKKVCGKRRRRYLRLVHIVHKINETPPRLLDRLKNWEYIHDWDYSLSFNPNSNFFCRNFPHASTTGAQT